MSTAIAVPSSGLAPAIENALMMGNLSGLTVEQRLSYYQHVCQSLGLNPLTRPFDYIELNGKLQLYAKRDCTDQLRKIHKVSIEGVEPRQVGKLYIVVASARDGDNRTDQSTGAVSIEYPARYKDWDGKWKDHPKAGQIFDGEELGNAMMKAETKAKRRVTLSICGLGILDESEIADLRVTGDANDPLPAPTVVRKPVQSESAPPKAQEPQGAIPGSTPPSPPQQSQQTPSAPQQQGNGEVIITERQGKMLFAIQRSVGISDEECKRALGEKLNFTGHRDHLPKRMFNQALDAIDPEFRFHQREGR